jgi:hypothetical protein
VAEYAPDHINSSHHKFYETEYNKIHKASSSLHFVSLVILSFMVVEVSQQWR